MWNIFGGCGRWVPFLLVALVTKQKKSCRVFVLFNCLRRLTVTVSLHQRFEAHSNPGYNVDHMVRWGGGVWMAFSRGSSIHLFHTESLELLQEVNVGPRTAHLTAGNFCSVLDHSGSRSAPDSS